MAPVVSAVGLTKRFGEVAAVTDLSFDLEPRTVTGFLGPNGAGKTTTLRMLLGLAVRGQVGEPERAPRGERLASAFSRRTRRADPDALARRPV
jgi:ABC-type branched-subunit amino acid transport system ATPase component